MNNVKIKKLLIIIVGGTATAVLGLMVIFYSNNSTDNGFPKEDSRAVGYNPNMKKPKNLTSDEVALPGFDEIHVQRGSSSANVALANPSFNHSYLKYIITMDKTGKELLATDLIAPGRAITQLPIPVDLQPGKYSLSFLIQVYNKDSKAKMNSGENKVSLIVE